MAALLLGLLAQLGPNPSAEVPGMSWDLLGGGTGSRPLVRAELGFSELPRLGFELPVAEGLLIGGWTSLDFGHFRPGGALDDGAWVLGATARFRLVHDRRFSVGVGGGVGLRTGLSGGFDLLVPLELRALYAVERTVLVGLSLDLPLRFAFPSRGRDFAAAPVLLGVAGEWHLLPSLAVFALVGAGPTFDGRGDDVAFRISVGAGYRL